MKKLLILLLILSTVGFFTVYLYKESTKIEPAKRLSNEEFELQEKIIIDTLADGGEQKAFAYIKAQLEQNDAFAKDCHPLLHILGHEAYHINDNDLEATLEVADEVCNSGYIHGAIQAHLSHNPGTKQIPDDVCQTTGKWTLPKWQCAHGLGHGFMLAENRDLSKAIQRCESLTNESVVNACANGVYMELFFVTDHSGDNARSLDEVSISNCMSVDKHKLDCYLYAPTAFLQIYENQYKKASEQYCMQAESEHIASCQFGVGSQLMKDNITNPSKAVAICQQLKDQQANNCLRGGASSFFYNTGTTNELHSRCTNAFATYSEYCIRTGKTLREKLNF